MHIATDTASTPQRSLTVAEAALALNRSRSWVRDRICDGRLTQAGTAPATITAESLAALRRRLALEAASRRRAVPYLRLVVNNLE